MKNKKHCLQLIPVILVLVSTKAALAGQWQIQYVCSGTTSQLSSSKPSAIWAADGGVRTSDGSIGFGSSCTSAVVPDGYWANTQGSVTANLIWHPDVAGELPPSRQQGKLTVIETAGAQARAYDFGGMGLQITATQSDASNGNSGDISVSDIHGTLVKGAHFLTAPVSFINGQWRAQFPTKSLSSHLIASSPHNIVGVAWADISYKVQVTDAVITANSTIDTANWDPQSPRFFSGTGCTATGTAVALSGNITQAQLCIGENGSDTVVRAYPTDFPNDTNQYTSLPLSVMFDSTHFQNASDIVLKLKVWDSGGNYYEGAISAPAKNRMFSIVNQTFGTYENSAQLSASVASGEAGALNYDTATSDSDTSQDIVNTLQYYTTFHAVTHGDPTFFMDCLADDSGGVPGGPDGDTSHIMNAGDIEKVLELKKANLNLPPITFAHFDACEVGSSSSIFDGLDVTQEEDTAGVGWPQTIWMNYGVTNFNNVLWNEFSKGHFLIDAVAEAEQSLPCVFAQGSSPLQPLVRAFPAVYGDPLMTLSGVYRSSKHDQHYWYRPI
ncbi:hypothetical protein CCAX7_37640 [Capsulimonas corticalis]|uniref:Uncharacterized protein n=1 Tax=Capsulimonas corticalis TaxID=2219043 RepID=A0A402D167_9BACT|nr:hypothetical protein [Capsulimonas corticalis]BDI31713.1 hypothetical protein CCAX7_37640 [Capsulimonas corticalis]